MDSLSMPVQGLKVSFERGEKEPVNSCLRPMENVNKVTEIIQDAKKCKLK